jgi:signal peptidase I
MRYSSQFREVLGDKQHMLLNDDEPSRLHPRRGGLSQPENCRYSVEGVVCKVPPGTTS